MRAARVLSLLVAVLAAAPPAAADAATCERRADGPALELDHKGTGGRYDEGRIATALAVCDRRRGRRTVLARGLLRGGDAGGELIGAGGSWGRRVAFTVLRRRRGRETLDLRVVAVGERPRTVRRLRVARGPFTERLPRLDAAITSGGSIAWVEPGTRNLRAGALVILRRGGRPRRVRSGPIHGVDVEDGRTLRLDMGGGYDFIDLDPASQPGCPERERFRPVLQTAAVTVTRADYAANSMDVTRLAYRICSSATGRDHAAASLIGRGFSADGLDVAGADAEWVLFTSSSCFRGCSGEVFTARADPDRRLVQAISGSGSSGFPGPRAPLAIRHEDGRAAWVTPRDDAVALVLGRADGRARTLDTGPPSSIAALRFEGTELRWERDGQPRSAAAP